MQFLTEPVFIPTPQSSGEDDGGFLVLVYHTVDPSVIYTCIYGCVVCRRAIVHHAGLHWK